jgi:hypothetical protein
VDRQRHGGDWVTGYSDEARSPTAGAGVTLWFAVSAFHGVAGALVHRLIAIHSDASMDVDAV